MAKRNLKDLGTMAGSVPGQSPQVNYRPQSAAKVLPFRRGGEPPVSYPEGPHWFAVYTNIKCEQRAKMGLDEKGYRTFLPEMTKWVTHARQRSVRRLPLLSRYLFVEVEPDRQGFAEIRATDGVECIVGTTGTPMVIPRDLVEKFIYRQEIKREFDYAAKEPISNNAKVIITSGEWDNLIGVVTGVSKRRGGELLVRLLGERHSRQIARYAVRAAL
jgi:transcriptional antiterminator RfaH